MQRNTRFRYYVAACCFFCGATLSVLAALTFLASGTLLMSVFMSSRIFLMSVCLSLGTFWGTNVRTGTFCKCPSGQKYGHLKRPCPYFCPRKRPSGQQYRHLKRSCPYFCPQCWLECAKWRLWHFLEFQRKSTLLFGRDGLNGAKNGSYTMRMSNHFCSLFVTSVHEPERQSSPVSVSVI